MIAFKVIPSTICEYLELFYCRNEYSFFMNPPSPTARGVSIVVNYLQLWFDDHGRVLYVDGYCPYQGWRQTTLSPPSYFKGGLFIIEPCPESIPPGTAVRLNDLEEPWPVYVNSDGWVCIGDPEDQGDIAVEFAPRSVAVLVDTSLTALWLRPVMCDSSPKSALGSDTAANS